jgi:PKHD-type hydroxylase
VCACDGLETDWRSTGPVLFEGVLPQARCDVLRSAIATDGASPRSYHGLVDPTVRECVYIRSQWSAMPELRQFLVEHVEPVFNVRASAPIDAPLMVYRYWQGVGFVPHHDEVTRVELERAAANGQPVVGGDLTIVAFLSDPDEYEGQPCAPRTLIPLGFRSRRRAGRLRRRKGLHRRLAAVAFGERFTAVALLRRRRS